ncbi:MAG: DUF1461 domain-containing protein [Pseudomonadota bacterium]
MIAFLRTALGSTCLLLCVLAVALLPLIFSANWYEFNCRFHDRCPNLEPVGVEERVRNMGQFFLHREPLAVDWDPRGAAHLADVRDIYDVLAVIAAAALILLVTLLAKRPADLGAFARGATLLLLLCVVGVLPVFGYFWEHVFHPALFDNDLWRTRPGEVLWSLSPRVFFRNSAAALLGVSCALCALMWWLGRRAR